MNTFEDNVRAILQSNFAETKDEIIKIAVKMICSISAMPQDALISREALKKAFLNHSCTEFEIKNKCRADENVIALIDNAPTVTDRTEEVLSLQNTIAKLVESIAENERPQGEWIEDYTAKKKRVVACNKCHCLNILGKSNFCPNCGAEMKGGAE